VVEADHVSPRRVVEFLRCNELSIALPWTVPKFGKTFLESLSFSARVDDEDSIKLASAIFRSRTVEENAPQANPKRIATVGRLTVLSQAPPRPNS
jgi:hypothetical protein